MWRELIHNNHHLVKRRQSLRNAATSAEKLLWQELKKFAATNRFRRQHSIGPYVVDFYCPKKHLVIELDGAPHQKIGQKKYDIYRTRYLNSLNITVLRFWNSEVINQMDEVVEKIIFGLDVKLTSW